MSTSRKRLSRVGCHKGTRAKRVSECIDFHALGKKYWLYDLLSCKEGDEQSQIAGHHNLRMYKDVVDRFSDQPWVTVIKGSVPKSLKECSFEKIVFAHIDINHPTLESGALGEV